MIPAIRTYTDAPPVFDGFRTITLRTVGKSRRGPVREVETPAEHAEWQRSRYASGMYICASEEQFLLLYGPGGVVELNQEEG